MRLSSHILSDKDKEKSAFLVAYLIRDKRPHLDLDEYLEGAKA